MAHDNAGLTVSQGEATRVEQDTKRRLLASRKLSLVVDLDQTIIHATVDPTVGEWMADKDNANYEALSNVRAFQLMDDGPGMHGCWYYIKLRPGLEQFLKDISRHYELHIYTMGTRTYAKRIADIVDPSGNLFGDRILSRDESGSLTVKNLQRLFPVDTRMVVIIDDRGDVWRWNPNLIKVAPYDFFVGIGDINSSFLPQRQDLMALAPPGNEEEEEATERNDAAIESSEAHTNGTQQQSPSPAPEANNKPPLPPADQTPESDVSTLEHLVNMGGGDNLGLLQEQTSAQEETIQQQVEDRPLLQKQKQLDAGEDGVGVSGDLASPSSDTLEETAQEAIRARNNLFVDSDHELDHLRERLEDVHRIFFEQYDKRCTRALGGRAAELRGEKSSSSSSSSSLLAKEKGVDLKLVPDVKTIIPQIKRPVLDGVVVVFSGVLPLGTDTQNADISLWAKSFGAIIAQKITSKTTHLVAGRNRTAKVREATRYPKIKIATTQWLLDSLTEWKHVDEEPYLLPVHPEDRGDPILANPEIESGWLSSSEDDEAVIQEEANEEVMPGEEEGGDDGGLFEEDFEMSGLTSLSPIGIDVDDQDAVHEELKEFLGSDDESESDAEAFMLESAAEGGKKRKRDQGEEEEERNKRSRGQRSNLKVELSPSGGDAEELPPQSDDVEQEDDDDEAEDARNEDAQATYESQRQEAGHSVKPEEEADELEQEMMAAFEDENYDAEGENEVTQAN